jgi:hypothetical protein
MSGLRASFLGLTLVTVGVLALPSSTQAQGCVASRMSAGGVDAEGSENSYFLPKGKWQSSFGYRTYRSHRHFVGDVEQSAENVANGSAERDRAATEVINHVHIPDLTIARGITDKLSVTADLPYFVALRRSPYSATRPTFATPANGIGDLNVMARYWLANPTHNGRQNLALGVGVKLPTGNDRAEAPFLVSVNPTTGERVTQMRPVDQSIQPGDGGYGLIAEFQAFKYLGNTVAFASGSYLLNPREQNDFDRDPSVLNPDPLTRYLSIADQFAARVGVGTSLKKKIGVSLAARLEGVPSSDLIGGDLGRRRPGYSIGIEPGVSYSWKGNALSLSVPYYVRRVRTQSYSDKIASERTGTHVQGDAAFADYMVVFGVTTRF